MYQWVQTHNRHKHISQWDLVTPALLSAIKQHRDINALTHQHSHTHAQKQTLCPAVLTRSVVVLLFFLRLLLLFVVAETKLGTTKLPQRKLKCIFCAFHQIMLTICSLFEIVSLCFLLILGILAQILIYLCVCVCVGAWGVQDESWKTVFLSCLLKTFFFNKKNGAQSAAVFVCVFVSLSGFSQSRRRDSVLQEIKRWKKKIWG